MKILSTGQIRQADAYTIEHEPITSIDLMERAGVKCFDWIYENAPKLFPGVDEEKKFRFKVFCGTGNNGGDGLVIARMLQRHGYTVEVYVIALSEDWSDDFSVNFKKLSDRKVKITEIRSKTDLPVSDPGEAVLIDAIFGIGLSRPVEGIAADVIDFINDANFTVISIDMPSGLGCDGDVPGPRDSVVYADYLLTFQVPKLPFFLEGCVDMVGQVTILDIGLHPDFLENVETDFHLFTGVEAGTVHKLRPTFSHKGTFGHVLVIAGARGKRGAATLAALGALRAGAGLVTVHTDKGGADALHGALPEAMLSIDAGEDGFCFLPPLDGYDAIVAGPGLGTSDNTVRALKLLIQEAKVPLILDADALNILAENPTWFAFLPVGSILTPHPGEFARLIGGKYSHTENIRKQADLCKRFGIHIVLKGAYTSTGLPDGRIVFNTSGNPGMATGGMGDVLAGVIAALCAQGYTAAAASSLGAYVHGLAGDLALDAQSVESLLPTDLAACLGRAFKTLKPPKA